MTAQQPIAISAEALLSLPIDDLIALYNAESRRLAGSLSPHLVDASCKPLYIVKRFARLPVYYQMRQDQASNESAAMLSQPITESAERAPSEAERAREAMPLNVGGAFNMFR